MQDCYNANPDSMEKAIEFIGSVKKEAGAKKIFVLGDMLELGSDSKSAHEKTGVLASNSDADLVIFIGTEMKSAFEKIKNSSEKNIIFIAGNSQDAMENAALEIKNVLRGSSN